MAFPWVWYLPILLDSCPLLSVEYETLVRDLHNSGRGINHIFEYVAINKFYLLVDAATPDVQTSLNDETRVTISQLRRSDCI